MKIFFDNCIFSLGETLQYDSLEKEVCWGGQKQTLSQYGYIRKIYNESWKKNEFLCLPTIFKEAESKKLSFFTYNEIKYEGLKRRTSIEIGNILNDVNVTFLESAVERGFFFRSDFYEHLSNEKVIEFCKWLLAVEIENFLPELEKIDKISPFTLQNLRKINRYRTMCSGLPEKQLPDAFHLWTAEVHGIDLFLTTDKKFINAMTQSRNIELPCTPITPSDLLEMLNIQSVETLKYNENEFINYIGVSHKDT